MTRSVPCLNLSMTVVVYALCLQTSLEGRAYNLGKAEVCMKTFLSPFLGAASPAGKMSTSETRAKKWRLSIGARKAQA